MSEMISIPQSEAWTITTARKTVQDLTIRIEHADGRVAIIDYGGDSVTFSGELPVDDAAKVFFEAVGAYLNQQT